MAASRKSKSTLGFPEIRLHHHTKISHNHQATMGTQNQNTNTFTPKLPKPIEHRKESNTNLPKEITRMHNE
ncbi:hypothetical protein GIB67_014282 [Kingdonia uniflora]|uniref:Uncharacterized protein n=1 Tax=Kingdonia uniflora TaxID=39325 RepID=A0A7J7M218_9MAGN|nr:hypothetical protein GIB67_014282 [Kingdonia uniflora]